MKDPKNSQSAEPQTSKGEAILARLNKLLSGPERTPPR